MKTVTKSPRESASFPRVVQAHSLGFETGPRQESVGIPGHLSSWLFGCKHEQNKKMCMCQMLLPNEGG